MKYSNYSKCKSVLLILSLFISATLASTANAQSMTQEQIDQMAAMMRSQGQSDAQVEKFIEQMKSIQKMSQDVETNKLKGMTEMQAVRNAKGLSDKDMAIMDTADKDAAAYVKRSNEVGLEYEKSEFDRKHGAKPDANVRIGAGNYTLKVIECTFTDDTYDIKTEGGPGTEKLTFNAKRAYSHLQKKYYNSIHFKVGKTRLDISENAGTVTRKKFAFDGKGTVYDIKTGNKSEQAVQVELACP